jgi:signal transduction histidine kinase
MVKAACCFIVCENFYPEIQAAVQQQGLTEVEVCSFPSHCCSAPVDWAELSANIQRSSARSVVVFGGYCLRDLTAPPEELSRCQIRQQEQCHHLLCNPTLVDAVQQNGTYLLSPGWLRYWRTHISSWGFDRPTAIEFFGESLQKLLLLDTGTDPEAERNLAEFGRFLEMPTEVLPIGLEFLGLSLRKIIEEYQQQDLIRQKEEVERQAAESAMTLDLIRIVTRVKSRPEVVSSIIDLFTMLFDPKKIYFIPVRSADVQFDQAPGLNAEEKKQVQHFYESQERYLLLNKEQGSFLLRIGRNDGRDNGNEDSSSALLFIFQVAYPIYIHQYINTALAVSEVCALSLKHVQTLKELVRTSHLAGKTEAATEVLHNVGNTLNSILVSSEHIRETVQQSSGATLPDVVQLIQEHQHDREHFYTHDPRGQKLPAYFARLSEKLSEEREFLLAETKRQLHHIRRVAEIIQAQQDTAKRVNLTEQIDLPSLFEESLGFFQKDLDEQGILVERQYEVQQSISGEPHKILQVMNNLIRNAVDAFDGALVEQQKIILRISLSADQQEVIIEIRDNGKGMQENILRQAFIFGFTTKKTGHGFGLHNAANLAVEMGGSLTGESKGPGQGAQFKMRLPVMATGRTGRTA